MCPHTRLFCVASTRNGIGKGSFPLDRHLALLHGFQQRGLGLRRGLVDLIGQDDVRKDRTLACSNSFFVRLKI